MDIVNATPRDASFVGSLNSPDEPNGMAGALLLVRRSLIVTDKEARNTRIWTWRFGIWVRREGAICMAIKHWHL